MLALALAIAALALTTGWIVAWLRGRRCESVDLCFPRILMYHMVRDPLPGATFNKLRVAPENFDRQIRWLAEQGWYFATMAELAQGRALPPKSVILTFDDGYADNLLNADPILARYGARATLYLVSDRFDRDWSTAKKAHHDSGELMREPKLSNDQVKAMLASSRWELGGHTFTHANLASIDDVQRDREIGDQRRQLREEFGAAVLSFAYPFGIYGRSDVNAVQRAGYANAVTTEEGISTDLVGEALELKRIKVSGKDSLAVFCRRMEFGRKR